MNLPDLGVGLVHLPGLGPLLEELCPVPDVIEVEPQALWSEVGESEIQVNAGLLRQAGGEGPVLVHSVGYPVGGQSDGDPRQVCGLRETLDCLKPAWWSEHASFVWAGPDSDQSHLGFLMPPAQSREAVRVIADRIKRLQDMFGLPFAFETGVNYLRPLSGELPDGTFWGEIADSADCGILLDLHNIWTNQANDRVPADQLIAELPLERVWEVHMAGGQSYHGYWLDSHSGLPPPGLVELAAKVVPQLPNLHAIILEIIPDYVPATGLTAEEVGQSLRTLRRIWETRGRETNPRPRRHPPSPAQPGPSMGEWDEMLRQALRPEDPQGLLKDDPGVAIYRDLIAMGRRGMVVEALPMTVHYLMRALGEGGLDDLFHRFWQVSSVQPFMSGEARAFAEFARWAAPFPHLSEVLHFEVAAHRAAMTGTPVTINFTCEPEPLFRSIMAGQLPDIRRRDMAVEVTPPKPA